MDAQYDAVAPTYDSTFQTMPYRIHIEEWSVLQALGDVRGLSILDLATGTGHYARVLKQRGASEVVAVDLSPDMLAFAQGSEDQQPLGITYHQADVSALDLGRTFDRVLAVYLLHYAPDQEHLDKMAQAIARHLAPGGRFLTYQLNPTQPPKPDYYEGYGLRYAYTTNEEIDGRPFQFQANFDTGWSPPISAFLWSESAITKALADAGLTDITWAKPTLAPTAPDAAFWQTYLDLPHCMVLSAVKPA